ncbi:MAG: hypothetical protein H5U40_11825, partial [Polyangiaceae bacterium]|nr:hypothetical protein [Polyangiaceae bacterium]
MPKPLCLFSLAVAAVLSSCGGVSIAATPVESCGSRGCDRAVVAGAAALECDESKVLVRDLGVDRYRATGCGRTVVLDCGGGCRATEPPRGLDARSEVAYRASFELLCAPSAIAITEAGGEFVASCREVAVRYACSGEGRGCARQGVVDPPRYALRQVEPAVLSCLSRSRADLRLFFDARGALVRIQGEGFPVVRMRGSHPKERSAETKRECLREAFTRLPAHPELARTDLVFAYGGPAAASPSRLSAM